MFRDRADAGEQLARKLASRAVAADVVLAIPRGGLPLGRAVADALDAPLDVVVAKKLGAPSNPELAIGAVAEGGERWLNHALLEDLDVSEDYVARTTDEVRAAARTKAARYREGGAPDLAGRAVVVVDDGVATGATMRACLEHVRAADPSRVTVAVPVGPADTSTDLGALADEVVVLDRPTAFRSVGAYYESFDQVTDEEAMASLESR